MDTDNAERCMIFVMGVTGAGKSNFVNCLKAGAVVEGHSIRSQTAVCNVIDTTIGNQPVAIVDTPGFDDSHRSDDEILAEIAGFLSFQYQLGIRLKGIIYLHRITDNKTPGSGLKYLEVFRALVGDENLENVVLATTMWSELRDEGVGLRRDMELRGTAWKHMEEHNSAVYQFDGSKDMAVAMLIHLMGKPDVVLQIQRELVDRKKLLDQTTAAQHFVRILNDDLEKNNEQLSTVNKRIDQARGRKSSQEVTLLSEKRTIESERNKAYARREILSKDVSAATGQEIKKKGGRYQDAFQIFLGVTSLAINIVANLLPLFGVAF